MTLENVKILLELDVVDTSKDSLLNLYINRAKSFVLNYCEVDKIPFTLDSTVEEMACFSYRQKGVENIESEEKGSLTENYLSEYPTNIMKVLNSYKEQVKKQNSGWVIFI